MHLFKIVFLFIMYYNYIFIEDTHMEVIMEDIQEEVVKHIQEGEVNHIQEGEAIHIQGEEDYNLVEEDSQAKVGNQVKGDNLAVIRQEEDRVDSSLLYIYLCYI